MGEIGSESRSLGQILEKSCWHPRGHSFDPNFLKHEENVRLNDSLVNLNRWLDGVKKKATRSNVEQSY